METGFVLPPMKSELTPGEWMSVSHDELNQMLALMGLDRYSDASAGTKINQIVGFLNYNGLESRPYTVTKEVEVPKLGGGFEKMLNKRVSPEIIIGRLKEYYEPVPEPEHEFAVPERDPDYNVDELMYDQKFRRKADKEIKAQRHQLFREKLREERNLHLEKRRSSVNVKEIIKLLNRDPNYYIQQKVDMMADKDFTKNPVGGFPGSWDGSDMDFWMFEDLNDYPTFRETGNLVTSHLKNIEKPEYSVHSGPEAPQWERNFRVREYSSMIEAVDRFFQDEVKSAGQDTFKFTFSFGSIHKRVEKNRNVTVEHIEGENFHDTLMRLQATPGEDEYKFDIRYASNRITECPPILIRGKDDLILTKQAIKKAILDLIDNDIRATKSGSSIVALFEIKLISYRLHFALAGKIPGLEMFNRKQSVFNYDNPDNFCFWGAYFAYKDFKLAKQKKDNKQWKATHDLACQYYNVDVNVRDMFIRNYKGFQLALEGEDFCNRERVNIRIFDYTGTSYVPGDTIIVNDEFPFFNICIRSVTYPGSTNIIAHVVYIKDTNEVTGHQFCSKCGRGFNMRDKHWNAKRDYENHIKKCDGKLTRQVKLDEVSQPFVPFEPVLKTMISRGVTDTFGNPIGEHGVKYTPTKYYITYDFETYECPVNEASGKSTTILSRLTPMSVSMCSHRKDGTFTYHFSLNSHGNDFMEHFINKLFQEASIVNIDNVQDHQYMSEFSDLAQYKQCRVLGFNSAKFDMNLFINYLAKFAKIMGMIGSATSFKSVTVVSNQTTILLLDARNFVAGGTLDSFAKDFGGSSMGNKGCFPYEAVTSETIVDLMKSGEPLPITKFFSTLKQGSIPEVAYNQYCSDLKELGSHWAFLEYYNNKDVEIMIPALNFLINFWSKFGIDMLQQMSLSKCADLCKYRFSYKDFSINGAYELKREPLYKLSYNDWKERVFQYRKQDEKKGRDHSNNVSTLDYQVVKQMFEEGVCYICGQRFTAGSHSSHYPTLDRIDNSIGHTLHNCRPCCLDCNCRKSDKDEHKVKFEINIKRFALSRGLPFTLDQSHEKAYHIIRDGITGGLANVHHRVNIKGSTLINKLKYDEKTNTITDYDTDNIVTHCFGIDFNSLYPHAFSSEKHPFVKYTGGRMFMPGYIVKHMEDVNLTEALHVIYNMDRYTESAQLFIVKLKGYIPSHKIQKCVNFAPIIRNFEIELTEEVVGPYMFNLLKQNDVKTGPGVTERKLTQGFSTAGEFMSFSSYYLWFLMDEFEFTVTEVSDIILFSKHDSFKAFVSSFREDRIKAALEGNKGLDAQCKNILNASYGYDGMNTEKFSNVKMHDRAGTFKAQNLPSFRSSRRISEDLYEIASVTDYYKCNTPIQCAYFTLDNAKYWYLNFIYNFMERCIDMEKVHFCEGDTDSMYWAASGSPTESPDQLLTHVVKDVEFYNENVGYFMPRSNIVDKLERKRDEKKPLGVAIEKASDNMVCITAKCYTAWNNSGKVEALKVKGVSKNQNKHITHQSYLEVLNSGNVLKGTNYSLRTMSSQDEKVMSKTETHKTALSPIHIKMQTHSNGSCHPYLKFKSTVIKTPQILELDVSNLGLNI